MTKVIKWPHIGQLHNVKKTIDHWEAYHKEIGESYMRPAVAYRAKVKLDGTNAAVQITPDGEILAQSRSKFITPENDNYGFAQWVEDSKDYFEHLREMYPTLSVPMTIFGEYVGSGIQKRCSISKIDRKVFAVFAIQMGKSEANDCRLYTTPAEIGILLSKTTDDMIVIPWQYRVLMLDYDNSDLLQTGVETLTAMVNEVEECDPLVKDLFGIEGLGEGLVLYPQMSPIQRNKIVDLMFKVKGEKHTVVKQKKVVIADPEFLATVGAFVEKFVTENRLEQGFIEGASGDLSMKQMGNFLKWVGNDVRDESKDELEVSGLKWNQVSRQVSASAKDWFVDKIKEL